MNHFFSKTYAFLGMLFILLPVNICCAAADLNAGEPKNKMTINVGIYAPFSSKSAFIGRNMLGAMEIARDQLKSQDIHYEFYTLDNTFNQANAASTLQKFIDAHHINVLLTEGSESGELVAPLAKKNKLLHFCLTEESLFTDGMNNFKSESPNHQRAAILTQSSKPEFIAQFKQEYFSNPVSEAGYAFDIFHLVHQSAILSLKTHSDFSSEDIATHLLALGAGTGVMGPFHLSDKGVSYKRQILTA